MPLTKSGLKVMRKMMKEYGMEKGKEVFYASINKKKAGSSEWHNKKLAIKKRVAAENAVERMKQNLIYTMDVLGIDKIELEDFNVSISNSNPALEIDEGFDLRRLPLSCYKIVTENYETNKIEIKKYLKDNGLNIKGLTLIQKPSLRIR